MANPDRARGLQPVYHKYGGSWNNALAQPASPTTAAEDAHNNYYIGMPVTLANIEVEANTELLNHYAPVKPMIDEDDEALTITEHCYGVVVGFANAENNGDLGKGFGMYDPTNLEKKFLVHSDIALAGNDWLVYIAPADGWVFKVQTAAAQTSLVPGAAVAIGPADTSDITNGSTTTGVSNLEIEAVHATGGSPGGGWMVVGFPESPDNDLDLANAEVYVVAMNAFMGNNQGPAFTLS